jgi:hypothetical protein
MRFELLDDCVYVLTRRFPNWSVPREGGLAIAMTEKLEDIVTIIYLTLVCSLFQCDFLFADSSFSYSLPVRTWSIFTIKDGCSLVC